MIFSRKNQWCVPLLAAVFTILFLVACSTESDFTTSPSQATAKPTATPVPTTVPYEEFASATISPADPARLAKLTKLMSLIPNSYGSSIYLDMESVRSNDALTTLISPEALGMDVALPSMAISLLNTVAVAVDFKTSNIITPFQADFAIEDILELATSFGLNLDAGNPTPYESHDVWDIDVLGTILSMASADETMGVATSGQGITARGARALAEASLDTFDGRSAQMLDEPGLLELLGGVPSGFVTGVLSDCERIPMFRGIDNSSGCVGVVISADVLPGNRTVFHSLIGFTDPDLAKTAMGKAAEVLENQSRSHGFEDFGMRQEDQNLRVRVISELSNFPYLFELFSYGR